MPKRPQPLAGLADIAPYVPGKAEAGGKKVWKLSANESAMGPSPKVVAAASEAAAGIHIYPDGAARDLKTAIAEIEELDPSRLIIGSGSDEVLQLLIRAYAAPGEAILQSAHGFSYYHVAAAAVRVKTIFVPEQDFLADVDALLAAVTPEVRIVFVANPNNPTGTVLMAEDLRRLRDGLPDEVMLVLDGAYAEYMTDEAYSDGRDLVDEAIERGTDNVVMTRTFSKIYGLGGARVGWGYGPPEVISILERIRPPFNITVPSLKAAEAAIRDQAFMTENRAFTLSERERLKEGIEALGFATIPSHANFVTFDAGSADDAKVILAHLEADGILIRSAASSGLPSHLRVTVGPAEASDAFLESLKAFR
ncbi:histidinol-phosphate transaminase [Parvularcula marina]|uniref:histidinol-phosphate transaminase n=1 Tax=Parvularcula marina TaxID=2292771 RepID=UPI003518A4E4